VGIAAFIAVERRMGDDALIPLKLFRIPTFAMSTVLGVLVGFGMFGALLTVPLYLQLVNGATPTESGFQMLPMIAGLMISSIVSGQLIARTGRYKIFPITGTAFMALGFFWFTTLSYDKPYWFMMFGMLLVGLGLGQLMQTLTIASQNSVGPRDIGVATSASTFFRQIGGTLGTAVLFSVLFSRIPQTIAGAFADRDLQADAQAALADPAVASDPANASILGLYQSAQGGDTSQVGGALNGDTSFLNTADRRLAAPFLDGFANATVTVFWVALAVVLVAFLLSFFLKATPLRQKSAIDEAHDDAQAALAADAAVQAQEAAAKTGALVSPDTGSVRTVDGGDAPRRGTAVDGASEEPADHRP
jgi:MFS family permease